MAAVTEVRSTDYVDTLVHVLDLIRTGAATTKPEIGASAGLSRTVVNQRIDDLTRCGLVEQGGLGPSTGGRAPRRLAFRATAGVLICVALGATTLQVAITDLTGTPLLHREATTDIAAGPDTVLDQVEAVIEELLDQGHRDSQVWAVGLSVPGPVEFETGLPTSPPIMPGWDRHPVRERFAARYACPVWVDNDVNVLALGELRAGHAIGVRDLLYVKVGTGIGAGLVSGGVLHRGSQGCAGDIGHVTVPNDQPMICRCGNTGCLEALAAGAALARDGRSAAESGESPALAEVLRATGTVTFDDVAVAAKHGDRAAIELLTRAGRLIGESLAAFVNFFNPAMVILSGQVVTADDLVLAAVRETVYRRSLPLATRDLRMLRSAIGRRAGVIGTAAMIIDELFSRQRLPLWIESSTPAGKPWLAAPETA